LSSVRRRIMSPTRFLLPLLTAAVSSYAATVGSRSSSVISVASFAPPGAGVPLEAFVSFSIEFAFFPDYAGNISSPNTFSNVGLQVSPV